MDCYHCGTELIWGGDNDTEDSDDFDMETNLSCPGCGAFFLVYHPRSQPELNEID